MRELTTSRQGVADLAKGIAILLMIQVHLLEIFAQQSIFDGLTGKISLFLGGPPVALVFMVVLGYYLGATRRSFLGMTLRGAGLLVIALLLNGGLNFHLLLKISSGVFELDPWQYLLGVDILFLAALSILLLAILRRVFRKSIALYLIAALAIGVTAPLVRDPLTTDSGFRYLLAFLGGHYEWSYFPLFPWLAYPLLGVAAHHVHQRLKATPIKPHFIVVGFALSCAVVAVSLNYGMEISATLEHYYHHGLLFVGWTVLFLICWFGILSVLERKAGQTIPLQFLKWLGQNITLIFILQWLLIGNIGTALYKTQNLAQLSLWYLFMLTTVSLTTSLLLRLQLKWANRSLPS
jgi:uncharacterized membrane protein